ncbi:hypothetical protein Ahy_B02g060010 [Arachis hypogaea]|uniref:Protein FAR1-RELATED SEQUENCE n=1 Tax=Arachis hypogaea TaxID=3818 RepID=A0A445AHT3_ARAHY|nr:hypothetical protein Ahy_B02g060010 [Arachis hypogaea]
MILSQSTVFVTINFHTVIPCTTKSGIEAQFQHVYTYEKFRKVQAQFRGKVNYITRSIHSTLGFMIFEVFNSTFNKFFVTYDVCQCLLFESRDMLCRHSLSVLSFERVDKVAPKYILERWKSEELIGILHWAFDNVMAEMQEYQAKSKGKILLSHEDATLSDVNDLQFFPQAIPITNWDQIWKKDHKCNKEKEKATSKRGNIDLLLIREKFVYLNLLDGGSIIQSSSSLYDAQDINYS